MGTVSLLLKRCVFAFCLFFSFPTESGPRIEPPVPTAQFSYLGFEFRPGRPCDNGWIDKSWCEATQPKDWKAFEIEKIKTGFDSFARALPYFVLQVQANGFRDLYRYTRSFVLLPTGSYAPLTSHGAWVWNWDMSINFGDGMFGFGGVPFFYEENPALDVHRIALLHEFAHAYATGPREQGLRDQFLQQVVGWKKSETGQWQLRNFNMNEIKYEMSLVRELASTGKFLAALRLNREYGLKHGFPTLYSMTNPDECFSEMVSFSYFDITAEKYLGSQIVSWIKTIILR